MVFLFYNLNFLVQNRHKIIKKSTGFQVNRSIGMSNNYEIISDNQLVV